MHILEFPADQPRIHLPPVPGLAVRGALTRSSVKAPRYGLHTVAIYDGWVAPSPKLSLALCCFHQMQPRGSRRGNSGCRFRKRFSGLRSNNNPEEALEKGASV